jgi:hypothetical protein
MYSSQNVAEILQHNAQSHIFLKTQDAVTKLGWTGLSQPPYGQDLAPTDFRLFGELKGFIRARRIGSDDEVTEEVRKWLRVQNSNWY